MAATRKKTPGDVTDLEREQLRFFLARDDLAATLAELNPSLAWLPMLAEMKLIKAENQLVPWIEKNFADADAVREVVANIQFFGPETANILQSRLDGTEGLRPLLLKCWRLMIRHMRTAKRGVLRSDWFSIAPRIKRGERSIELLEQIADVLRPKPRVGKRLSWYDEEGRPAPERPSDLISIDYEIDDAVTERWFLSAWPENAPVGIDDKLLKLLTQNLSAALEDAIEAGVESDRGYSISDTDVPSVARHQQNAYRSGFLPIVCVMAELWTRLSQKDAHSALEFVDLWKGSPFRLVRRLGLFAAADQAVAADKAADVLLSLPQAELFLTNSSVEVHRLVRTRWREFPNEKWQAIEHRIMDGPPSNWFREGADKERIIDNCRFNLLASIQQYGVTLSAGAQAVLDDIRKRWPQWEPRPQKQAGFHIWHEGPRPITGDSEKLKNVPDDQLVDEATKVADTADLLDGDSWQALCRSNPQRALRGLEAQTKAGKWPVSAWERFLWAGQNIQNTDSSTRVARLLLDWPKEQFSGVVSAASWWVNHNAKTLEDDLLWPLWDRIEATARQEKQEPKIRDSDALTDAMNAPGGHLAEVLLKKLTSDQDSQELSGGMRERFDKLIGAPGRFGMLARVRLAAEVSFLFERAPAWTKQKIVPLFDWSSPDASAAWSARQYSNYIGSPELFALTKQAFLDLFARTNVPDEDLRTFAEWLTTIMVANQSGAAEYPLTAMEARSALRQAGVRSLLSVGHRLAIELEQAKQEEKISKWRTVVGPVFQSVWPLDVELQTSTSTFKLVQILLGSGNAFPEAAGVILPFIRPENPSDQTAVFSISESDDILYSSCPERMLDLLSAVVGDVPAKSVYGLGKALDRLRAHAPQLADRKKFQKLLSFASNN
jgi:hypothetical protein